jgi:hypothetical protein
MNIPNRDSQKYIAIQIMQLPKGILWQAFSKPILPEQHVGPDWRVIIAYAGRYSLVGFKSNGSGPSLTFLAWVVYKAGASFFAWSKRIQGPGNMRVILGAVDHAKQFSARRALHPVIALSGQDTSLLLDFIFCHFLLTYFPIPRNLSALLLFFRLSGSTGS